MRKAVPPPMTVSFCVVIELSRAWTADEGETRWSSIKELCTSGVEVIQVLVRANRSM